MKKPSKKFMQKLKKALKYSTIIIVYYIGVLIGYLFFKYYY